MRHLIELGGLVVKSGIADLTGSDRTIVLGALIWIDDKLKKRRRRTGAATVGRKGKEEQPARERADR